MDLFVVVDPLMSAQYSALRACTTDLVQSMIKRVGQSMMEKVGGKSYVQKSGFEYYQKSGGGLEIC